MKFLRSIRDAIYYTLNLPGQIIDAAHELSTAINAAESAAAARHAELTVLLAATAKASQFLARSEHDTQIREGHRSRA
jgi:hypothetical protein